MAISVDSCVVALLGRDDNARQQLRQALEELGAAVTLESDLSSASAEQVLAASPNVVIVNLEENSDDGLDHLQEILDAPAINVVFNDADVSQSLEGWDLARWARHLAAKVLGHNDTMPPRPAGSGRLVTEQAQAQESHDALSGDDWAVVETSDDIQGGNHSADEGMDLAIDTATDALGIDFSSLEAALELSDAPAPERLAPTPEPVESESLEFADMDDMSVNFESELEDLQEESEEVVDAGPESVLPAAGVATEFDLAEFDLGSAETSTDAVVIQDSAPETTDGAREADDDLLTSLGAGSDGDADLDDFVWEEPVSDVRSEAESPSFDAQAWSVQDDSAQAPDEAEPLEDHVAALAAQLDALAASTPEDDNAVADLDFSAQMAAADEDPALPEEAEAAASELISADVTDEVPQESPKTPFSELSLAAVDDEESGEIPLAEAKPEFDFSSVANLSLEPIGDELTQEPEVDPLLAAMGLVEAQSLEEFNQQALEAAVSVEVGSIEHVIVLGASIGGPDALRSFLAELPADLKAVILLVQHLESGYFERLAQQLQKFSALPIKVADPDVAAAHGEVLVIPATERVIVERDGRVVFSAHTAPPRYTPSIDDVLHDVADRFGKNATAIIFSGMAGDAVEGVSYLTAKGGEVWVQDPQSCVVSTMVDGALARGVVEFTGSPRELALRCTTKFKR